MPRAEGRKEKEDEITAIPQLLKGLNIKGAAVTIDAIGTKAEGRFSDFTDPIFHY